MSSAAPASSGVKSRTFLITWLLAVGSGVYLIENLWVDAWLRAKLDGLPSLVPEALTAWWFVVFGVGGIVCVVLIVCQVLVSQHRRISVPAKVCTGIAVIAACVLWGVWFTATSAARSAATAAAGPHQHAVTLTWNASTSAVAGYNIYRSTVKGRDYVKINATLVKDRLSYKDEEVDSGKTYYYVTRSVDAKGKESSDSAEVLVTVP
jgi:hypothetical protein